MKGLFQPASIVMNRCTFSRKVLLLAVIFSVPVALLGYFLYTEANGFVQFAAKERLGVKYIIPLKKMLQDVQSVRSQAALGKDPQQSRVKVDADLQEIDKIEAELGKELGTAESLAKLKTEWNSLKGKQGAGRDVYDAHTSYITSLMAMITLVADTSNLTLDPDIDSYYLMDTISTKLTGLAEVVDQANILTAGVLTRKNLTADEKTELTVISGQIAAQLDGFRQNMEKAGKANPEVRQKLEKTIQAITSEGSAYSALLAKSVLAEQGISADPANFAAAGNHFLEAVLSGYDLVIPELDKLLQIRMGNLSRQVYEQIAVSLLLILVGVYLFIGFYLSLRGNISELRQAALQVADGDLTVRIPVCSRDEMAEVASGFNIMVEDLKQIVAQVSSSSVQVATAAGQLTATAEKIAIDSDQVASQSATVATASEEMSSTSGEIARSCVEASESALQSNRSAESGVAVMHETLSMMGEVAEKVRQSAASISTLEQTSNRIDEIVGTIEDIADQTNLLALNAAIEAARAGEQGRGFAVVADEVRALAERTTKATREIAGMIRAIQGETRTVVDCMDSGVQEVGRGTARAEESKEVLQNIVAEITRASMQINQIATAAEEQTATTNEIAANIHAMNSLSFATARGAQESAQAASQLATLSDGLKGMVSRFRIG